jgi:predicted acyl esterase
VRQTFPEQIGREEFNRRVQAVLQDPEIACQPDLVETLKAPHEGANMHIVEYILNYLDNEHFAEKAISFRQDITIPAYFGGCWGMHMLHLAGDLQSFERWSGPKKLTIGPPYYLDRPVYQYAYESLRWFDYWLKGVATEIMDEPPINLFIRNSGEWKAAHEWPLPQTKWTEFYLHQNEVLFEHEFFPEDDRSVFVESPQSHGSLNFRTPKIVENTEVIGPLILNFWASTTDVEVLWFVTLFQEDEVGVETILTRGWLRGSQRAVDATRSTPWSIHHPHDRREPLTPGEIYEFNIEIVPTAVLLKAGMRLGLRIRATDQDAVPTDFIDLHAYGRLWRETHQTITIFHNDRYPSHLLVPVTNGNRIGTFASGGIMPPMMPH